MFDVLVVEDDTDQAELYRAALAQSGFSIRVCGDGVAAVTAVAERLPDLAVLDVNTPIQDGYDVCRAIRQREPADQPTIVIMVTARDDIKSKLLGFAAGADDYLVKPVDLRELRSRVARWLGSRTVQVEVIRRRRHEAIREIVATVGDDLKSPLALAIGSLDQLLDRGGLDNAVSRDLTSLREHLHRIARVLNALVILDEETDPVLGVSSQPPRTL